MTVFGQDLCLLYIVDSVETSSFSEPDTLMHILWAGGYNQLCCLLFINYKMKVCITKLVSVLLSLLY